jgi:hypothetical protein
MDAPDHITSVNLQQTLGYWFTARGSREFPERADIDPTDIPRLLPHVVLTDVFHDPLRFRYRLIGTAVTAMAGRDATGRWLDEELYGENLDRMLWAYRKCVDDRAPVAVREQIQFADRDWIVIEAVLLPLGSQGGRIDVILSAVDTIDPSVERPPQGTRLLLDTSSMGGSPASRG